MTKLEFQSIIEKYHLDGLVENVKWVINKDKTLSIDFMSPSREMIGNIFIRLIHVIALVIGRIIESIPHTCGATTRCP